MVPEFRRGWAFSISSAGGMLRLRRWLWVGGMEGFPFLTPRLSSTVYGNSATHNAGMSDVGGIPGYEGAL